MSAARRSALVPAALGALVCAAALVVTAAAPAAAATTPVPAFTVTGTPVTGSKDSSTPPPVGPGAWTDTLPGSTEKIRYTLRRTPGSTVFLSTTFAAPPGVDGDSADSSSLQVTAPDSTVCGSATASVRGTGVTSLVVASIVLEAGTPDGTAAPCDGTDLVLTVQRGANDDLEPGVVAVPFQLLVQERAAADDADSLPAAAPFAAPTTLPVTGTPSPGAGARSFGGATVATAAGVSGTIRPGELVVYRVAVDWGQQPSFRVDLGGSSVTDDQRGPGGGTVRLSLRSPVHTELTNGGAASYQATYASLQQLQYRGAPVTGSVTGAAVRYRNASEYSLKAAGQPGDYYLVVSLNRAETGIDYSVPITVRAVALGERSGVPGGSGSSATPEPAVDGSVPAGPTPSGSPTPDGAARSVTDAGGPVGPVSDGGILSSPTKAAIGAGGLVLVAVLVLVALLLLRRPRDPD